MLLNCSAEIKQLFMAVIGKHDIKTKIMTCSRRTLANFVSVQ